MDTKKFQRATEIMSKLKEMHENLENLKGANVLTFSISNRCASDVRFFEQSKTFKACRDVAICETKKRIAQFEKEFNEL